MHLICESFSKYIETWNMVTEMNVNARSVCYVRVSCVYRNMPWPWLHGGLFNVCHYDCSGKAMSDIDGSKSNNRDKKK